MRLCLIILCLVFYCLPGVAQSGTVQIPHVGLTSPTSPGTPVQSAKVYLYTFGTVGYGSLPTSLLTSTAGNGVQVDPGSNAGYVLTDTSGAFDLTSKYACPSSTSMVYLVAIGGNPGLAAGTNNAAIHFVTVLGDCGTIAGVSYGPVLDDLDTAITATVFQQFIDPETEYLGSPSAAQAEAVYASSLDLGQAMRPVQSQFSNATEVSSARLYAFANILNACSYAVTTTPCSSLYTYTKPSGGTAPVDVFQAAYYMASNPAHDVSQLFNLITTSPPFPATLTSAPHDWLVSISYSGAGLNSPGSLAIDANGAIWILNPSANSLSEFGPHGQVLSYIQQGDTIVGGAYTGGGLASPYALAIDQAGNVWIANCGDGCPSPTGLGNITEFSSVGQALSPTTGFELGILTYSSGVAVDRQNHVWVSNDFSNSLAELSQTGQMLLAPSGVSNTSLKGPLAITFDASGSLWIGNSVSSTVSKFDQSGSEVIGSPFSITGLASPLAIAVDPGSNLWTVNGGTNTLSELTNSGVASHVPLYSGGGLSNPQGLAIDSWGTVWVANSNNTLTEVSGINTVLSPSTGFQPDGLDSPSGIAIDQAGSLWISNSGNNTLSRILGVAKPAVTPLATAISTNPVLPGMSARCKDGGFSSSANRSGTCSHNGGVAEWLTM